MPALYKASTRADNGGNSSVITVPFATAATKGAGMLSEGDWLVMLVAHLSGAKGSVTPPPGWIPINMTRPTQNNSGNVSGTIWAFRKRASAYDIVAGNAVVNITGTNWTVAYLINLGTVDVASPISAYSVSAGGTSANPYSQPPAVVPVGAGCLSLIFSMNSNSGNVAAGGVPTGYTEVDHFYPPDNYRNSFVAISSSPTTDATAKSDYLTWTGQYSQFAISSGIIIINPVIVMPMALASSEYQNVADSCLNSQVEAVSSSPVVPAQTVRNVLQGILAVNCGTTAGATGTTPSFTDPSGTRNRVSGTLDVNNNRTAVSLSFS